MSTLHEQLLARIGEYTQAMQADEYPATWPLDALRAVVERHRPVPCGWSTCTTPETHRVCAACGAAHNYPCEDIQAIARELGVDG